MRVLKTLAIVATLAVLGCGGGGDDADNGNPTGPPTGGTANGTMTATIGGASWRSLGAISVSRQQSNNIGFAGTGSAGNVTYAVSMVIANATGPGTHNLNIFAGGDGSQLIIGSSAALGWGTSAQGGSGTVTITSLTANRIVGTFSGTLAPAGHTNGNLVVTSGTFDITF